MDSHRFWTRWLLVACSLLSLQGVSWMLMGSFDPLGFYDRLLADAILEESPATQDALLFRKYYVGLLGATDAAFFILMLFLVAFPYRKREGWGLAAIASGILFWFTLDTIFSVVQRAFFNIWLVNIPCLLLIGIPLVMNLRSFTNADPSLDSD